jgi:hypothetical protein
MSLTFKKEGVGRAGAIICRENECSVAIDWEMSGVSAHDILLAPIDLRKWDSPKDENIPRVKQRQILHDLRSWLKAQNVKSNIDLKDLSVDKRQCSWNECTQMQVKDSAYCQFHIDETLLLQ